MSLNCNEINLILNELDLKGAFIQDIIQPNYDSLALYTYKEGSAKTVFICCAQNECRIHETRRKITKNEKPLRFMEFLRSRIKGCRINSCAQIGLERVVLMELSRSEEEIYHFYIKLWNNAANVILCDEHDLILEPMFRRPDRYEMKDEVYIAPAVIEEKLEQAETRFPVREWKNVSCDGGVAGPQGCRDCPAGGVAEAVNAETELADSTTASESFSKKNSEHFYGWREGKAFPSFKSFNEYIDWWYSEHADNLSREALLEKAEKWYNINRSKRENALNALIKKQESFKNAGALKHQGDLVLTYGHLIDGASNFLECLDYETGETVRLLINPKKSAQENAAEYYKNYKKAVSGADELAHDIELARAEIEKLDAEYERIRTEQNPIKIEQMLRHDSTPKQKIKKSHPGLEYEIAGWLIYVGRDANENDELLRHHVRGEDLWLHVRDFPGGYVFIKARKGKTVPLDVLLDAGNLAVYYSKARNNGGATDLYYTHVKYLRRAKNGPKGLVIPTQEKNLCITPDRERLRRCEEAIKNA